MAATKYQVLYRYTNPNSNQFITNDVESKYNSVLEFYHDEHKIAVGLDDEILDANNEKLELLMVTIQQMIIITCCLNLPEQKELIKKCGFLKVQDMLSVIKKQLKI